MTVVLHVNKRQIRYYPTRIYACPDVLDLLVRVVHWSVIFELSLGTLFYRAGTWVETFRFGLVSSIAWTNTSLYYPALRRDGSLVLWLSPQWTKCPYKSWIHVPFSLLRCCWGNFLTFERNHLWNCWQRPHDVFNREIGKLHRDMLTFRRLCWELSIVQMAFDGFPVF